VGARALDILGQFLTESATVTLVGGAAGVFLGVLLAMVAHLAGNLPFAVPPGIVVAALAVSTGVGLVFGLYPAVRASRQDPIEALHYE
jgi:putative ABC transport system permease protein